MTGSAPHPDEGEARPSFESPGQVSLWLSTASLREVHDGHLEGGPEVLAWLFVEFGVAVNGAFSTNYTPDHEPGPLRALLEPLHASEAFVEAAVAEAKARGLDAASFVLALYDLAYDPATLGLDASCGAPWLVYLGSFRHG